MAAKGRNRPDPDGTWRARLMMMDFDRDATRVHPRHLAKALIRNHRPADAMSGQHPA